MRVTIQRTKPRHCVRQDDQRKTHTPHFLCAIFISVMTLFWNWPRWTHRLCHDDWLWKAPVMAQHINMTIYVYETSLCGKRFVQSALIVHIGSAEKSGNGFYVFICLKIRMVLIKRCNLNERSFFWYFLWRDFSSALANIGLALWCLLTLLPLSSKWI